MGEVTSPLLRPFVHCARCTLNCAARICSRLACAARICSRLARDWLALQEKAHDGRRTEQRSVPCLSTGGWSVSHPALSGWGPLLVGGHPRL
eukprot:7859968-Pyramimonas_sp.AAC.1